MTTRIVILAAGSGKRMKADLPKVLTPLHGTPLVRYVLDAALASGVDSDPVIVVGVQAEKVKEALGRDRTYALQGEQKGTGHAVQCAEAALAGVADAVIVLNGDQPFVSPETIQRLRDTHAAYGAALTMFTSKLKDFKEWRKFLADFGRVVRDERGNVKKIVEAKDAQPDEQDIKEVNPTFFCFDAAWLWKNLRALDTTNAQGERYLTDLVQMAIQQGKKVFSMSNVDPREAFGINTPEHLEFAHSIYTDRIAGRQGT